MVSRYPSVHTGLFVQDLPTMVAFYRDVLGFATDWDGGPYAEFPVADGGLFMFDRKLFTESMGQPYQPPVGYNTTMEIGVCVGSPDAVDAEYARLTALGIRSLTPASQSQGRGVSAISSLPIPKVIISKLVPDNAA